MNEQPTSKLLPVTFEELEQAVSHALRFDGRKQFKLAGEIMGKITAGAFGPVPHAKWFCCDEGTAASAPKDCPYAESARRVMDAAAPTTGGHGPGEA